MIFKIVFIIRINLWFLKFKKNRLYYFPREIIASVITGNLNFLHLKSKFIFNYAYDYKNFPFYHFIKKVIQFKNSDFNNSLRERIMDYTRRNFFSVENLFEKMKSTFKVSVYFHVLNIIFRFESILVIEKYRVYRG